MSEYDLRILLIEITQKCNAKCDHCGSRCDIDSQELLTKEDIIGCLKDVKENIGTDAMINISGGEPLMRKDLFEIMKEVSEMGFDWGMVTNGTLINDEVIEKMKESNLKTITVSIDGLKETHESLRHLPGSFDRICENIRKLRKADFLDHIQVTFTSNMRNVYEFPELYEILDKLGIDSIRTSFIDPIGRANDNENLFLGRKEIQFITKTANQLNKQNRTPIVWGCPHFLDNRINNRNFNCFAGKHAASILYNGDIFVCPNVPRRQELIQGNIRTHSFSKVWKEGYEYFRNRQLPEYCKDCYYKDKCAGDSVHSWDFDKERPNFCYRDIFGEPEDNYKKFLKTQYGKLSITEVSGEEGCPNVYIEPEAYEDMKHFFHMGKKHPLSMYEQQLGLVGFRCGNSFVIRYVFEDNGAFRYKDNAIFTKAIIKKAEEETKIINANVMESDDSSLYKAGAKNYSFLGFAHSHPVQEELCYSIGDEAIHKRMIKRFGDYLGILVYPEKELLGVYTGKDIKQGNLIILELP